MKISASTIRKLLDIDPSFISPLSDERRNMPFEGSKVDLTLDSVFKLAHCLCVEFKNNFDNNLKTLKLLCHSCYILTIDYSSIPNIPM